MVRLPAVRGAKRAAVSFRHLHATADKFLNQLGEGGHVENAKAKVRNQAEREGSWYWLAREFKLGQARGRDTAQARRSPQRKPRGLPEFSQPFTSHYLPSYWPLCESLAVAVVCAAPPASLAGRASVAAAGIRPAAGMTRPRPGRPFGPWLSIPLARAI